MKKGNYSTQFTDFLNKVLDMVLGEIGIKPTQLRHRFSQDVQGILLALDVQFLWLCEDGYWLPLRLFDEEDNGVRLEVVDQ